MVQPPTLIGTVSAAVNDVAGNVATGVQTMVKPTAAAAVATTFSFPLALMVVVLLFLVVQPRLDRLDPKLRTAPGSNADAMLGFEDEDAL